MNPLLAMHLPSIEKKVTKLCAVKGAWHLYDDVLGHALFTACEQGDYNPGRASFETYIVNHAKWHLGDLFRMKEVEIPVEFTDEYTEERWMMTCPTTPFIDPFEVPGMVPCWYKPLWVSLTHREQECLAYTLLASMEGRSLTYRELGKCLHVSHVTAGSVLKTVRQKTKVAILWTRALSGLVDGWQGNGTFRGY